MPCVYVNVSYGYNGVRIHESYVGHMFHVHVLYLSHVHKLNYFVFPFVYLKEIMEYEYTNHMSIHMFHVHVLYLSHVHKRNTQVWCERLVFFCLVVISHKRVLGRQSA